MLKHWGALGAGTFLVTVLAAACGGSDEPVITGGEDAGTDTATALPDAPVTSGDTGPAAECSVDGECVLPTTTPAGCAEAKCDPVQRKCQYLAKDADGDGHRAKACSATTKTIEAGDDCDDSDKSSYPGSWDGPPTSFDAGPGAQVDRCDQKDNDCNGSPDDGKLNVDGGVKTCKCDPTAPLACYEYSNGIPIDATTLDSNNQPKGACKKGTRSCPGGIPGSCSGAVGPAAEQCDNLDRDCNGISGNAGDIVPTAPIWYKDFDNDGFGDMATATKQQCVAPDVFWKTGLTNNDCKDDDITVFPGNSEICDGKDNNCAGGIDENVKTNYCADADSDTYCTATCQLACPASAPVGYRPQNTCGAGSDCNDDVGSGGGTYPGAPELCGDGVDSNCTGGDSETYPLLGMACTAGTAGVCRRAGSYECVTPARTSTQCSVVAGTSTNGANTMSQDLTIDMSQARSGYDPRWDWNCDNSQTVVTPLFGGDFRQDACGSGTQAARFEAACQNFTSSTTCNTAAFGAHAFNCEYDPPATFNWIDPVSPKMCGRNYQLINCGWNLGTTGSGCGYLNSYNATAGNVTCK